MNSRLLAIVLVLLVVLGIYAYLSLTRKEIEYPIGSINWDRENPSNVSASYLLLSNWINGSVLIRTGFPYVGEFNPFTLTDFLYGKDGILPMSIKMQQFVNSSCAFLSQNNTVVMRGYNGSACVAYPLYSSYVIVKNQLKGNTTYLINLSKKPVNLSVSSDCVEIDFPPLVKIFSPNSSITEKNDTVYIITKPTSYLEVILGNLNRRSPNVLLNSNALEVRKWLSKSPTRFNTTLSSEFNISLLLIKDDQNPVTGEFVASPVPIYYYSWVRDSSFDAIALQMSRHFSSALKYWLWMAKVQNSSGTWYTRYNFYTGIPDQTFGIPEYDSVGLFMIGTVQYYELTGNKSFLLSIANVLNRSLQWEVGNVKSSGILPQDLSIWEDNYQYNFWTQAIDDIGLVYLENVSDALGFNRTLIMTTVKQLNSTIQKYFYSKGMYAEYVEKSVLFENGKSEVVYTPFDLPDSSSILPLAMGLMPINSNMTLSDINTMITNLTVNGGLARFLGDTYHYTSVLTDSSGPMPPWVITTLFLGYYYAMAGNYTGTKELLTWSYEHSAHGLLPEAIDPRYGNPLPSTTPLTWSAAMFVINYLMIYR
ncbi:glycoside hydrolase [Sulfolobales archaeon HS-7]|nr:glycoside hydrolase [Sulfolobales archaeon HS-7]